MQSVFRIVHTGSKEYKQMDRGVKSLWTKTNKMIQFNKRQNTNFQKAPFLKIYAKTLELKSSKTSEFVINHLNEVPVKTWRIEYTIKNKKHLNLLKMPNTLGELCGRWIGCTPPFEEGATLVCFRCECEALD